MQAGYLDKHIFEGLKSLAASAFPKWCAQCGAVYTSAGKILLLKPKPLMGKSGLTETVDEEVIRWSACTGRAVAAMR